MSIDWKKLKQGNRPVLLPIGYGDNGADSDIHVDSDSNFI